MFAVSPDATLTGVSVVRSGNRTSSRPGVCSHPRRWKSVISTISRRGSADSVRMLAASFSAGA